MALEHLNTKVKFYDPKKDESWEVKYMPREYLTHVEVICNDETFHYYNSIPGYALRAAKNPNKTQALAIIRLAKKEKKNEKN